MSDASGGCGRKYGQSQQADLVFQILREDGGQIAGEQDDAARFIEAFGNVGEALGYQAVLQALKIFEILAERITNVGGHVGIAAEGLHGVERSGEGEGEFVEMMLEFEITGETET